MKIKLIFIVIFILFLTSCITYDQETLTLSLNPGVDTVEVNTSFTDAGAKATLEGRRNHRVVVIKNTVDITQVGTYHIIYETTYLSTKRQITRIVSVIDETAPILTLNQGIDTIYLNEIWIDAGVTVSDLSGLMVEVKVTGDVITSLVGEYQITYTATDAYGNQSIIFRYVSVISRPII